MDYPIIGHRGWAGAAPENTRPAFQKALNNGKIDGVECDIQLTKDGKLVVIHDFTIDRTSDGRGLVGSYTYEELLKYDFGGWFSPEFTGEKILLFRDLLRLIDGKKDLMVEIKRTAGLYPQIAKALLNEIKDYPKKHLMIESFDHLLMKEIKEMDHSLCTGLLSFDTTVLAIWELQTTRSNFFSCFFGNLTASLTKELADQGIKICAWTVDETWQADYVLKMRQPMLVCSNFPEKISDHMTKVG